MGQCLGISIALIYCNLGLEEQLGSQKESYDQKLTDLENKLAEATAGDKIAKKEDLDKLTADFEEKVKNAADDSTQRYTLFIHMALNFQLDFNNKIYDEKKGQ